VEWTKREMDWYYKALKYNYYPQNVIDFIRPLIKDKKSVIDVGSGIGTFAMNLVNDFEKIIAVDQSKEMIDYFKNIIKNNNNKANFKFKIGDWNNIDFENDFPIGALITAYSGEEVIGNKKSINKMTNLINGYIFLFVPTNREKHSFYSDVLYERLGKMKRNRSYIAEDVKRILDKMNINYKCKKFNYNFGQIFSDFDDAVDFFKFHYDLEQSEIKVLEGFLHDYLKRRDDYLWIDNYKESTMFYWKNSVR